MTLSMYQASVPVFIRGLQNLSSVLDKAAAHAEAKKIDPAVFINARLAPDMIPLARQIQIATDTVKGGAARLAGVENPSYADTETTFPELKERLAKTIAFLKTVPAAQIDGSEEKTIVLKVGGNDLTFPGQAYLLHFVIPNLFFHVTVAYAILRHNGVELGKRDFLGPNV
jgi:hypothetical protein